MSSRNGSDRDSDDRTSAQATTKVGRRQFLTQGSIAAALALTGFSAGTARGANGPFIIIPRRSYVPFRQPDPVPTSGGSASTTLNAMKRLVEIDCDRVAPWHLDARTYNGKMPGPSFYIQPGDKIEIQLNNQLPPNTTNCPGIYNGPNCLNDTNLHFHGLHVSPSSLCQNDRAVLSSDDVLMRVLPGSSHPYCVWLPSNHAPGTHWYHAHRHGSTAIQVSSGMAGAIIIREPAQQQMVDESDDFVWLLQEVTGAQDTSIYRQGARQVEAHFLVNGICQPTLRMKQGKIQRWRFVNATATPRGLMNLKLCQCETPDCEANPTCSTPLDMYLIAVDGISFYGKVPQPQKGWNMAPGNRADFLVKIDTPGTYKVVKDRFTQRGAGASVRSRQVLAYIDVEPASFNESIPATIPGDPPNYLLPIPDSEIVNETSPRQIEFSISPPAGPGKYKINGKTYLGTRIDQTPQLNTAEQWVLENARRGAAHPFHIHVNPFQLEGDKIDPTGPNDPTNWRWWDTIPVPPGTSKTMRQRYLDYPGEIVLHCHILIHEDQGMMENVLIEDPQGVGIGPCCPGPDPGSCNTLPEVCPPPTAAHNNRIV